LGENKFREIFEEKPYGRSKGETVQFEFELVQFRVGWFWYDWAAASTGCGENPEGFHGRNKKFKFVRQILASGQHAPSPNVVGRP